MAKMKDPSVKREKPISRANRPKRISSDKLSELAGIPEGKHQEAQEIQMSVSAHLKPGEPHPLGIWSGGCYYVATSRPTNKYKYGTYWRLVKCVT